MSRGGGPGERFVTSGCPDNFIESNFTYFDFSKSKTRTLLLGTALVQVQKFHRKTFRKIPENVVKIQNNSRGVLKIIDPRKNALDPHLEIV